MQWADDSPLVLQVVGANGQGRDVQITPHRDQQRNWFLPIRGTQHYTLVETRQADGVIQALAMAIGQAKTTLMRIWLTLRSLFTGDISVTELQGPIGIARVAYSFAQHSGSRLLEFLAFLSFNLAVINFLPIPVLDGGHMVFLTWEAVTRRRPSEKVLIAATYFGLAFVLLLMVTVIFVDLERIPAVKQVVESVFG
jgi:regulator of sigma E protease